MKLILSALTILSMTYSVQGQSEPVYGFDGCYQLYLPNVMYPAFCLQGTNEEGIGGAGVRLTFFRTNTSEVMHCSKSDSTSMTGDTFVYEMAGVKELILSDFSRTSSGSLEGQATLGSTTLKFIQISGDTSDRLAEIAAKDCP